MAKQGQQRTSGKQGKGSDGSDLGWKVFSGLAAVLGAIAARKLLTAVWVKATGKQPPANPVAPTTSMPEAVGWAVLSGTAVGVARLVAQRQAAATWVRANGSLPAALREETS